MPKYAAAVDANQKDIVAAFRARGASVALTHNQGKGFPDLVVGFQGVNLLVEVKDGAKIPSKQKLTRDEREWHDAWRGQVCIVNDVDQVEPLLRMCREMVRMEPEKGFVPLVGIVTGDGKVLK